MDVLFIEDDELLEKCNNIWNKVSNSINKKLDCKPVYNKFSLKTKMTYDKEATDFHDKKHLKQALIILILQ